MNINLNFNKIHNNKHIKNHNQIHFYVKFIEYEGIGEYKFT